MSIKGHDPELPFIHYAMLSDTDERIELKSSGPSILIKDKKHYRLGETKSTADHEFTYYYNLVDSLSLD